MTLDSQSKQTPRSWWYWFKTFKETAPVIWKSLQIIFNKSFKQRKFPWAWKEASATAIYKKTGDKHIATNYEPVWLTSIACKLMGKFVRDAALQFFQSSNIWPISSLTLSRKFDHTFIAYSYGGIYRNYRKGWITRRCLLRFSESIRTVTYGRLIELMKYHQVDDSVVA